MSIGEHRVNSYKARIDTIKFARVWTHVTKQDREQIDQILKYFTYINRKKGKGRYTMNDLFYTYIDQLIKEWAEIKAKLPEEVIKELGFK